MQHSRFGALLAAGMLAFATLATAATPPKTSSQDIFPYPIHETSLANGLRVVVIPYDSPGIVAYFTVVRAGSRNEVEAGHSGFAHFFEHMMFRGTDKYSAGAYNEILKRMGADSNAFTTDDYTNFYTIGPASSLATMMDMESDRFKNLKYSEDGFKTESLAVLGEYNKGASNPGQPMEEKTRDLSFQKHTYKHTTIGFIADVKAMPGYYDYSRQFFERFYRPENVVVLVVGDVQPEKVFELAKKDYADWKPGYKEVKVESEPPQAKKQEAHIDWPTPTRSQMLVSYHTPAFSTANVDTAALDILGDLLFSESAPLYQDLVVQKQWVDGLQGGNGDHRDAYLFQMYAQVKSDDLIPKVQQTIDQYVEQLKKQPIDRQRLERVKSHLRYAFALSLNSPGAVAFQAARAISLTGDVHTLSRIYEEYEQVTPEDIQRVARQTFRPENETVVTLSHPGDKPAATQGGK